MNKPALFVLHGGPGADFRLLLPLKNLADDYYVVMWDARRSGLSQRVTKDDAYRTFIRSNLFQPLRFRRRLSIKHLLK